jgi:type IV secretory pathway TraG/TraD family ATPase VirD4
MANGGRLRAAGHAEERVHQPALLRDQNARSLAYNPLLEVRRDEWEVRDVATLCLVVPPSDISRTKPMFA